MLCGVWDIVSQRDRERQTESLKLTQGKHKAEENVQKLDFGVFSPASVKLYVTSAMTWLFNAQNQ